MVCRVDADSYRDSGRIQPVKSDAQLRQLKRSHEKNRFEWEQIKLHQERLQSGVRPLLEA